MMMVENEGGAAYTAAEIGGWLAEAGIERVELRKGTGKALACTPLRA